MSQVPKRSDFESQNEFFDHVLITGTWDQVEPCYRKDLERYGKALEQENPDLRSTASSSFFETIIPQGLATPTPSSRAPQQQHITANSLFGRKPPTDLSDLSRLPEDERDVDPKLLDRKANELGPQYRQYLFQQQQQKKEQQEQQEQQFRRRRQQLLQQLQNRNSPARDQGLAPNNPFRASSHQLNTESAQLSMSTAAMPGALPQSPLTYAHRDHTLFHASPLAAATSIPSIATSPGASRRTAGSVKLLALHTELEELRGRLVHSQRQTDELTGKCQRAAVHLQLEYLKLGVGNMDDEDEDEDQDGDAGVESDVPAAGSGKTRRRKKERKRGQGGGGKTTTLWEKK